jgi:hypothetical protein
MTEKKKASKKAAKPDPGAVDFLEKSNGRD